MHDRLGFEQHTRCGNAHHGVKRPNQCMRLRQIFAVRTQLFPNERHRIHAQNIHAQIGNEHHLARHRAEHPRIAVIQIPLERIERRPHPATVWQLRERARMLIGKNFSHRAVVLIRHPAVRENVIEIIKHRIAGRTRFRPLMLVRGVVENKIHHHRNARFAQGLRHGA